MRILMTADVAGGVWTYAVALARALGTRGARVTIATMGPEPDALQRAEAARAGADLRVGRFALEWMEDPWEDVARAGDWLLDLEREVRPDVVHLNGYAHGTLPWGAPALVVAHSCVLSWWRAVHGEDAPPRWARYRHVVEGGLRAADAVVAPTQAMLDEIRRLYGLGVPACVVHNGLPRREGSSQEKEPFILGAGRLRDAGKNAAALARAAADVPWPVVLAGDLDATQYQNVRLTGRLDRAALLALMRRASVFAAPARYEPFGLTPLEAALSGCALVLGDIPSLREVWDDAALYVDPRDHQTLARALRTLVHDDAHRREMGERAATRARLFDADVMGAQYLDLYRSLITVGVAT